MKSIPVLLLLIFSITSKATEFTVFTAFPRTTVEQIPAENLMGTFVNRAPSNFFRIDFGEALYPALFVYLKEGDTIQLRYDTSWNRIHFQTNLQALAELSEITGGYHAALDRRDLFSLPEFDAFKLAADSMFQVKIRLYDSLKIEYNHAIDPVFWDAEYCNILFFPLINAEKFFNDPVYLEYADSLLKLLPTSPKTLHSLQIRANVILFVENYIYDRHGLSIFDKNDFYLKLSEYLDGASLEYALFHSIYGEFTCQRSPEKLPDLYAYAVEMIKDTAELARIETAFKVGQGKIEQLMKQDASMFYAAKDSSGKALDGSFFSDKKVYLFVTAIGCPPCIKEAKWLMENQENLPSDVSIYTVVVGPTERFASDQSKKPYPWPVFYDHDKTIRSSLARTSVPQYFWIENGVLVNTSAPEPSAFFGKENMGN